METRRALNPAMPQALVWGQLLLYLGAGYAVAQGIARDRVPWWEILVGIWMVLAAWGVANERRWGWQLGVATGCTAVVAPISQLVRDPTSLLHADFLVLLVVPVAIVLCLYHRAAHDYERAWFV